MQKNKEILLSYGVDSGILSLKDFNKPMLWFINDELGIFYPGPNGGYCKNWNKKTKKWKMNPWNSNYLCAYQLYPGVEFIGYVD